MYIKETCFCNILYFVSFQLGLIFGTLWSLPVIGILLNTETILLLIGQEQRISALAQQYTQLFFPGVFAYCWLFLCMRYLVCQVYLLSKEMGFKLYNINTYNLTVHSSHVLKFQAKYVF